MEFRAPVLVRHAGGVAELRQLPPGFRFRPTDEELVVQYLRRKAFGVPLPAAGVIPVVRDLYGLDPWDIVPAGASSDGGEKYFFAVRPAAATKNGGGAVTASGGRWKPAAGKERPVVLQPRAPCGGSLLVVGVKRALAFAPARRGKKKTKRAAGLTAGWVMHEYRLAATLHKNGCSLAEAEGGEWVVCRVFRRSGRQQQQPRRRLAVPPGPGDGTAPSRTMPEAPASSSSASCVTDGSDQEDEVSS